MILCVPDLALEAGAAREEARWPRLARLLARADLAPATGELRADFARWLGLAPSEPLPVAPLTAAIDVPALAEGGGRIVRADPVHLRADPGLVLLVAAEAF